MSAHNSAGSNSSISTQNAVCKSAGPITKQYISTQQLQAPKIIINKVSRQRYSYLDTGIIIDYV
jgi:hypothetical protein